MKQSVRSVFLRPLSVWLISFGSAILVTILVLAFSRGEYRHLWLYYFVPVIVPFSAFLLDRAAQWQSISGWQWWLDGVVVTIAVLRSFVEVPFVSGHALFLSYALLTCRSWIARVAAFMVMLQVFYLKIFDWHDKTFIGGVLLGMMVAFLVRFINKRKAATLFKES